jgi:hypothetical protein
MCGQLHVSDGKLIRGKGDDSEDEDKDGVRLDWHLSEFKVDVPASSS